MKMLNFDQYGLLHHAYWQRLLLISDQGNFNFSALDNSRKDRFVDLVYQGFYPLTALSYHVFRRLDESTERKFHNLLAPIYEAELGIHPLIAGTHYDNVPHPEQYRRLMQSLRPTSKLKHEIKVRNDYREAIKLDSAGINELLAYAALVEFNATVMIQALQDFTAKWCVANHFSHRNIEDNFINEHALLEGGESDDQHTSLMRKLFAEIDSKISAEKFDHAARHFVEVHHNYLDQIMGQVEVLLPEQVAVQ